MSFAHPLIFANRRRFTVACIFAFFLSFGYLSASESRQIYTAAAGRPTFERIDSAMQRAYAAEWREFKSMCDNSKLNAWQYRKSVDSLGGRVYRVESIREPFVLIRRLCSALLTGDPDLCRELWFDTDSSLQRLPHGQSDRIHFADLDDNSFPEALVEFGCCGTNSLHLFTSLFDGTTQAFTIRELYRGQQDWSDFDPARRCGEFQVRERSRDSEAVQVIRFDCDGGQLIRKVR